MAGGRRGVMAQLRCLAPRCLLLGMGVLGVAVPGCSRTPAAEPASARPPEAPQLCATDQTREYHCDDLLPLLSSRPAPEPYGNCPGAIELPDSTLAPVADVATFDAARTAYTRKRVSARAAAAAPAGHSCCYGWCTRIQLARPEQAERPSPCQAPNEIAGRFCVSETENGTSLPAPSPFERCPAAIRPPEAQAFAVPAAAAFDARASAERRASLGLNDCCYSWCSRTPVGTVLDVSRKPGKPRR